MSYVFATFESRPLSYLLDKVLVLDGVADEGVIDPVAVVVASPASASEDPEAVPKRIGQYTK